MTEARPKIEAQMQRYFDGLYLSDVALLKQVFHPAARYVCATDPDLVDLDMETYFGIVALREAPAARKEVRRDHILDITLAGPSTALVRARCAIGPKLFTDFLGFVRTAEGWRIIYKLFHYDLIAEPAILETE